jgi:hypothetical protein
VIEAREHSYQDDPHRGVRLSLKVLRDRNAKTPRVESHARILGLGKDDVVLARPETSGLKVRLIVP